jgi:hypothetical protein
MPAGKPLLCECMLGRADNVGQPNANQQRKDEQRPKQQPGNQQDDS